MQKEFAKAEKRLIQASKSLGSPKKLKKGEKRKEPKFKRKGKLLARIYERIKNKRKDNNHKLTRKLISENSFIAFSKDNIKGLAKKFGRSVAEASHYQLRQMLTYKSLIGGTQYIEVNSKKTTMTCSFCGSFTGPTGLTGLQVRNWVCSCCGAHHDRDINAAINTLNAGLGMSHENRRKSMSGISCL